MSLLSRIFHRPRPAPSTDAPVTFAQSRAADVLRAVESPDIIKEYDAKLKRYVAQAATGDERAAQIASTKKVNQ